MQTMTKTDEFGIQTQVSMIPEECPGLYKVVVIHRFRSGNFQKTEHGNLSQVAAEGIMEFYK